MSQVTIDAKAELKSLRLKLAEKVAEGDKIVDSARVEDGTIILTDEIKTGYEANETERMTLVKSIEILEQLADQRAYLGAPEGTTYKDLAAGTSAGQIAAAVAAAQMGVASKSIGQRFAEAEVFNEFLKSGAKEMGRPWEAEIFDLAGHARMGAKDVFSQMTSGGSFPSPVPLGTVYRDQPVNLPHRRVRMRDLFNVVPITAAIVEFFRETGFTNAASVVPERAAGNTAFALKPLSNITLTYQAQTTKTIAHGVTAHRNTLDDATQVADLIDSELLYGLQLREDAEILSGNQTTNPEDLPGILNDTGIQTYSQSAGAGNTPPDNAIDAIRRACTKVFIANLEPTGVVVHPSDWETMELTKSTQGEYLLAVSIAMGAEPRIWRLPVVETPAITPKTSLVGAFGLGAKLYDRQEANVRIFEQHADYALRNAVLVLAEERLAMAVRVPQSFVAVTLS